MNKMKLLILPALLLSITISSQIEIADYERQFAWNIDQIDQIKAVPATSTCGAVKMEVIDNMFSGGCLGTLVRTYKYSDVCGNTAEAEVYVSLKDDKSPEFNNFPENITVSSDEDLPVRSHVTATDNADESPIKVVFEEEKTENEIIRTWTAIDACGNVNVRKQIITIENS